MSIGILSNSKVKELKSLHTKKGREELQLFIAEGKKCISDLLSTYEPAYIVCTQSWLIDNEDFHRFEDKILIADRKKLSQISTLSTPPDLLAAFHIPKERKGNEALNKENLYVALDNVQDPGNLGTIIRTCDWFGIYHIYASTDTVDVYNPKVVQSTMGSLCRVRIDYVNLEDLFRQNQDTEVYGTLLDGKSIESYGKVRSGVIILGNEGRGISEKLKSFITSPLTIPPYNAKLHPDSLNVAIANAVILSYFRLK